jgi:peptidase M50-like protein
MRRLLGPPAVTLYFSTVVLLWSLAAPADQAQRWYGLSLLVAGLALFLSICGHELGHVVGAKKANLQFMLFIVGPLLIGKVGRENRLQVQGNYHWNLFLGGRVVAVPKQGDYPSRQRFTMYFLAGPFASAFLGLVFMLLCLLWGREPTIEAAQSGLFTPVEFLIATFLWLTRDICLILLMLSLFPAGISDGARLLALIRQGPQAERLRSSTVVVSDLLAGKRPRDWEQAAVENSLLVRDGSVHEMTANYRAYQWALDSGQVDTAGIYLERLKAGYTRFPRTMRSLIQLEIAYYEARYRRNAEVARSWFNKVVPSRTTPQATLCRAEAAVLLTEGKLVDARMRVEAGLQIAEPINNLMNYAALEKDLLNDLMRQIETPSSAD